MHLFIFSSMHLMRRLPTSSSVSSATIFASSIVLEIASASFRFRAFSASSSFFFLRSLPFWHSGQWSSGLEMLLPLHWHRSSGFVIAMNLRSWRRVPNIQLRQCMSLTSGTQKARSSLWCLHIWRSRSSSSLSRSEPFVFNNSTMLMRRSASWQNFPSCICFQSRDFVGAPVVSAWNDIGIVVRIEILKSSLKLFFETKQNYIEYVNFIS